MTSPTVPLEVRVHADLLDVGSAAAWNELLAASVYPCVFRRWEWLSIWWKWFGENRTMYLLSVRRGRELIGIAPLYVIRTRWGERKLSWIGVGGPTCPEYLGPIVHRDHAEAAVEAIAGHFLGADRSWDSLWFPDVPPDDPATRALIDALARDGPTIRVPGVVCPWFDLPESMDLLMRRLSGHRRKRERRRLEKARRDFRVELHAVESAEEVRAVFPAVVELHRSSRGLRGESSPFANPAYVGFQQEAIETLLPKGLAQLYLLQFNGQSVAFQIGYQFHGKYYGFQTGFDAAKSIYSPGALLLHLFFEVLILRGIREFDFLRGEESYKNIFCNAERRTETSLVCRRAARTYAVHWIHTHVVSSVRRRAKRWLGKSPWVMQAEQ
ncbi:MAG: GNAT family N-acetyltransferase [Pirellulales bacterium]|nr:GNAT family N-acetyltransferase [Pirellulales bacterium]